MRRTVQEQGPHPVDAHVGNRLWERRSLLGMSQMQLAEHVGVSFQQVQIYEKGFSRIASSRLFQLSQILDVPVSYFFEGIPTTVFAGATSDAPVAETPPSDPDILLKRETLKLVRAYYRIKDEKLRRRLRSLVREVAGSE